ncbi:hypothetical protein ACHQM5_028988 [Ranunculus cassubicifolius]
MAISPKTSAISLLSLIFIATHDTCKPISYPTKPPPLIPLADVFCPMTNILKLGLCNDLLSSLLKLVVGADQSSIGCCTLLDGLDNLSASACVCEALKANVLGVHVEWALGVKLLVNACGKSIPPSFNCA